MLRPMRAQLLLSSWLLALGLALVACDDADDRPDASTMDAAIDACADDPGDAHALFVLPRDGSEGFFDLPFPNDVRRRPDGRPDLTGFPNPTRNAFVALYVDAISRRLDGFATNGATYLRFSRAVDTTTLPATPDESIEPDAGVFLIDVDPESPAFGARHPIVVRYQDCATRYWPAHTVALRPVYGLPLASARRYAAVVTKRVRPLRGGEFVRDADFDALVGGGGDAAVEAARAIYDDVFDVLGAHGVAMDEVLAVSVFTTQDAVGELIAVRDWMVAEFPAPELVDDSLSVVRNAPNYTEITGRYGPSPIFQEGELPYAKTGGALQVGNDGVPTVHGTFDARFTLTIPNGAMPDQGYPVVLYAHGTGGDHRSFVRDETAAKLAALGFAAMGVDQIHHGERNPTSSDPSILFFNFMNPDAARDNNRQSALDLVQQARLVPNLRIPVEIVNRDGMEVRFDARSVYFMGHSQGGLNGPIFLAIDDGARGGVLSAASGVLTPSLIHKHEPFPIPELVRVALALPGSTAATAFALEGFNEEHPIATLVQTWIEAADGSNYAAMIARSPREGFMPKSVLMTEGLADEYAPPASIEALAGAMGAPLIEPVHRAVDALRLSDIPSFAPPVTANVAGGLATMGLLQFPHDGHFAVFDNPVAAAQVFGFFQSLAGGGIGTIPPPP